MAHLEISNLNSAGSDSFAGAGSFLTELETTDIRQIFGGRGHTRPRRDNVNRNGNNNGDVIVGFSTFGPVSGSGPGGGTITIGNGNNNGNGNRIG